MAVENARPGMAWSRVARQMQNYVEGEGFSVVREFVGHGIGQEMHEDPKVPNFVSPDLLARDILLEEGLVIAVEPIIEIKEKNLHVRIEDTILVTEGEAVVLTEASPKEVDELLAFMRQAREARGPTTH